MRPQAWAAVENLYHCVHMPTPTTGLWDQHRYRQPLPPERDVSASSWWGKTPVTTHPEDRAAGACLGERDDWADLGTIQVKTSSRAGTDSIKMPLTHLHSRFSITPQLSHTFLCQSPESLKTKLYTSVLCRKRPKGRVDFLAVRTAVTFYVAFVVYLLF